MSGPLAPKDPEKKRNTVYLLLDKEVGALPGEAGENIYPIYLGDGRIESFARMTGNVTDDYLLSLLGSADGFKVLVHSIGFSAMTADPKDTVKVSFSFQRGDHLTGSSVQLELQGNGAEVLLKMEEQNWKRGDSTPGAFTYELPGIGVSACVSVKLYLNDGFDAPDSDPDPKVDQTSPAYETMIARSFLSAGNNHRVKKVLERSRAGQPVTIAFLGGSITQGAGAVPLQECCYARLTYEKFRKKYGFGNGSNVRYIKAGVGGTPSETGLMRYDRDTVC